MTDRLLAVVAASIVASGCAGLLDRVDYERMAPRLEYTGFSFDRPPDPHWYFLHSEESHTAVVLRRETGSPTHSFYARISFGGIAREPKSQAEFVELAEVGPQTAGYSVRELSHEEKPATIQNQWCMRYDVLALEHGAPAAPDTDLQMIVRGYRCLHPAFPKRTLDFWYSERGLPDELDPRLSDEGEAFLRGVRIDVAPGTPAR